MSGHTSHNALPRASNRNDRRRRRVLSVVCGSAFLAIAFMLVAYLPDSRLGRTIDAHLSRLADPESWIP